MANPNFPNNPGYNLYVGARYVPVFANPIEWDLSKSYEPLTIVTHQGNSYTSKTFVPANTQITNATYWALTGNYDAQVEQYRQEVTNYANQSASYFQWTNCLTEWIRGKNILIIGASNETPSNSWAYKLKTALNGIANVTINAANGRLLTGDNGGANIFVNNIANYDVIIMAVIRNDYWTNVDISTGNDASGYDTINAALFQMYVKAQNYPNKKVFFMGMFYGPTATQLSDASLKFSWTAYQLNLKNKCDRYGFNFLDAQKYAGNYMFAENVTSDGKHFTDEAHQTICNNVLNAIITDKNDGIWSVDQINVTSLITPQENFTFNNVSLKYSNAGFELFGSFTTSEQLTADTTYQIGSYGKELCVQITDGVSGRFGTAGLLEGYTNRMPLVFGFQDVANSPIYFRPNTAVNADAQVNFFVTGLGSRYINRIPQ